MRPHTSSGESLMPARRPLRAVTLDFWHTLFTEDPASSVRRVQIRLETIGRLLAACGEPFSEDHLEAAHTATGSSHMDLHTRGLDMTFPAQVGLFLERLRPGLAATLDTPTRLAIADAYAAAGIVVPPVPTTPRLRAMMEGLRERGLR